MKTFKPDLELRLKIVELYAQGHTTSAIVDAIYRGRPEATRGVPRAKIREAIRTCNPNHHKFAKKYRRTYEIARAKHGKTP